MRLNLSIASVILLALCSNAIAQIEALQIEGPHETKPGTLVRLTANTIAEETPFWIVLEPIDLDYEQVAGGKRLLFSTGCESGQRITVLLLAQQVRNGRIVTRQIRRTIKVTQDDSTAAPDVKPPANPPAGNPTLTESPLYLPVLTAWPSIRTDAAKALSAAVATNIDAMAAKCDAGIVREVSEIWRELSDRNRETLGIESSAWNPVATVLQREFQSLAEKLTTPSAHSLHLRAAAAAIRAAASNQNTKSKTRRHQ